MRHGSLLLHAEILRNFCDGGKSIPSKESTTTRTHNLLSGTKTLANQIIAILCDPALIVFADSFSLEIIEGFHTVNLQNVATPFVVHSCFTSGSFLCVVMICRLKSWKDPPQNMQGLSDAHSHCVVARCRSSRPRTSLGQRVSETHSRTACSHPTVAICRVTCRMQTATYGCYGSAQAL